MEEMGVMSSKLARELLPVLAAARKAEMRVSGDDRVSECDLEILLGFGERTLRHA
jgi:hypothetical protein